MAGDRTAGVFAGLWLAIAALQSYRSFSACGPVAGWTAVLWGVHALLLFVPLVAIRRIRADGAASGRIEPAVLLVLLAYIPMLVAMRLLEVCAGGP